MFITKKIKVIFKKNPVNGDIQLKIRLLMIK